MEDKRHTSFSMSMEEYNEISEFLSGTETVSQFCYKAMQEKIKRIKVRDKQARKQLHEKDVEIFEPIIVSVLKAHGIMK